MTYYISHKVVICSSNLINPNPFSSYAYGTFKFRSLWLILTKWLNNNCIEVYWWPICSKNGINVKKTVRFSDSGKAREIAHADVSRDFHQQTACLLKCFAKNKQRDCCLWIFLFYCDKRVLFSKLQFCAITKLGISEVKVKPLWVVDDRQSVGGRESRSLETVSDC